MTIHNFVSSTVTSAHHNGGAAESLFAKLGYNTMPYSAFTSTRSFGMNPGAIFDGVPSPDEHKL